VTDCIGCGSAAVSERSERTAQGYRRFRCRACGKQFNERSAGALNRTQYPSDVIALVVLWRLRYKGFPDAKVRKATPNLTKLKQDQAISPVLGVSFGCPV
jgi:hypothetical protein